MHMLCHRSGAAPFEPADREGEGTSSFLSCPASSPTSSLAPWLPRPRRPLPRRRPRPRSPPRRRRRRRHVRGAHLPLISGEGRLEQGAALQPLPGEAERRGGGDGGPCGAPPPSLRPGPALGGHGEGLEGAARPAAPPARWGPCSLSAPEQPSTCCRPGQPHVGDRPSCSAERHVRELASPAAAWQCRRRHWPSNFNCTFWAWAGPASQAGCCLARSPGQIRQPGCSQRSTPCRRCRPPLNDRSPPSLPPTASPAGPQRAQAPPVRLHVLRLRQAEGGALRLLAWVLVMGSWPAIQQARPPCALCARLKS